VLHMKWSGFRPTAEGVSQPGGGTGEQ
jgi:hypothetical protein